MMTKPHSVLSHVDNMCDGEVKSVSMTEASESWTEVVRSERKCLFTPVIRPRTENGR